MQFNGTVAIRSPREQVWAFLTNPESVGRCVPDLQSLQVIDDDHFKAIVRAGIGPVRGNFSFDATWEERTAPSQARVTARGKGPGSGVTVESRLSLADADGSGTALTWSAEVVVHGTIASVGARLLTGFAEKQTQQFFDCVRGRLEAD